VEGDHLPADLAAQVEVENCLRDELRLQPLIDDD